MKETWQRLRAFSIPGYLKNKYFLLVSAFLLWMLFFDQNNLILQFDRYQELKRSKNKKAYYEEEIAQINGTLNLLLNDRESLEKFAREKYYMKRDNEDVFIFLEADDLHPSD